MSVQSTPRLVLRLTHIFPELKTLLFGSIPVITSTYNVNIACDLEELLFILVDAVLRLFEAALIACQLNTGTKAVSNHLY
jgi:hypothetical protein